MKYHKPATTDNHLNSGSSLKYRIGSPTQNIPDFRRATTTQEAQEIIREYNLKQPCKVVYIKYRGHKIPAYILNPLKQVVVVLESFKIWIQITHFKKKSTRSEILQINPRARFKQKSTTATLTTESDLLGLHFFRDKIADKIRASLLDYEVIHYARGEYQE